MTNADDRKAEHRIFDDIAAATWGEEQLIALGFRPRTWRGRWFWLRYWSPPALWWLKRKSVDTCAKVVAWHHAERERYFQRIAEDSDAITALRADLARKDAEIAELKQRLTDRLEEP